jgi:hypothetical protein
MSLSAARLHFLQAVYSQVKSRDKSRYLLVTAEVTVGGELENDEDDVGIFKSGEEEGGGLISKRRTSDLFPTI